MNTLKKHKEWFGSAERYRELWGEEWEWVDEYSSEGDNGLGAYVAVGIEALRLTESRLKLELRVDKNILSVATPRYIPDYIWHFLFQELCSR